MTDTKPAMPDESQLRPRIVLGELAYEIAKQEAGNDKITQTHLEIAITKLQLSPQDQVATPAENADWLRAQLQQTNELLITLRYMILSLSAESDDEIQISLRHLNERLNSKQLKKAAETNQNVPSMEAIIQQMEILQGREQEQEAAKSHGEDREM